MGVFVVVVFTCSTVGGETGNPTTCSALGPRADSSSPSIGSGKTQFISTDIRVGRVVTENRTKEVGRVYSYMMVGIREMGSPLVEDASGEVVTDIASCRVIYTATHETPVDTCFRLRTRPSREVRCATELSVTDVGEAPEFVLVEK